MKKLVYIDACVRGGESRTRAIAEPIVAELSKRYEITTYRIPEMEMTPLDPELLDRRNLGGIPSWAAEAARRIAEADRLVIAAPFWDMSFPAALKCFFEQTSLFEITFTSTDRTCVGLCRCEKVLYITTRGMDIRTGDPLEQATPYLRALSSLWGLGDMITVAASNMDYSPEDVLREKMAAAIAEGLAIAREF